MILATSSNQRLLLRLLSFVGGHGTVTGDYYGISAKKTMGKIQGKGVSPFPSFPSPPARIFHAHPSLIFNYETKETTGDESAENL